ESQADGDVSETESNCSSMSGLQTPLFVRVTRRRQIVIPCQLHSDKKRHDKSAFQKLSRIQDEDDVSEAESCSSAVSGVQMPSVTRTTRNRKIKTKLQPGTVYEAQSEDISDAESCCLSSHKKQSITTKRITRSMQMKSQAENTKQTEKGNRIDSEDENLVQNTIKFEPVMSDSRPATELVSDTENAASSVTEDNKEPSSPESKCSSKPANTYWNKDMEEEVWNDVVPSSPMEIKLSDTESPRKKAIKNRQSVREDGSEEASGQIQEQSKILVRERILEHDSLPLTDCTSTERAFESQGQRTPDESRTILECKTADVEADAQQSFTYADKLGKGKHPSAVSSPQRDVDFAEKTDSVGGCNMLEIGVDSDEDQTGEYAESVCHSSERSSNGKNSMILFLGKDEHDESENSDVADTETVEENLCYKGADEKPPSLKSLENRSLPGDGLFVIDTEPGMSSNQKYYLDQVGLDSDAESKQGESEKGKESSDLEEAEEELIDEEEKDEDDDLLKNKIDVLHLSSSIDPGLNIKKLGGLYISFDAKKQKPRPNVIKQLKEKKKDELLQKSIITPDFEKKECVPPFRESLHQLKKQRRAEREKTTGDGWFGMKAPEITSELKNDLKVLKMRASLDPKHFYKKNDRDGLPKYFQVGTVVDSPIDFYHSRIPKKQRKRTIVEELLADSEFRRYNKKKYQEIMSEKAAFAAGKRNRKKKKFHN
ncbi:TDIF2 protein, partial [Heliornis fulica]|nr:TDIF2 protein [Heliornis fulica]